MDIFMQMSTTERHNDLISTFIGDILPLKRKKQIYALHLAYRLPCNGVTSQGY